MNCKSGKHCLSVRRELFLTHVCMSGEINISCSLTIWGIFNVSIFVFVFFNVIKLLCDLKACEFHQMGGGMWKGYQCCLCDWI